MAGLGGVLLMAREPFLEGLLAFGGGLSGEEVFHADVLVEVGPNP